MEHSHIYNVTMVTAVLDSRPLYYIRGGSRIFEGGGGSRLGLQANKGGGADGGPILGPMLKAYIVAQRGGAELPSPGQPALHLAGRQQTNSGL